MTKLWERMFVGSLRDAEALATANPHGVSTVITLCDQRVTQRAQGINYLRFLIEDDCPVEAGQFAAVMDAIAQNVRWGSVLIHCIGGSSRSPILTAAWMHIVGYRNIEDALVEIGKRRSIEPSPILLKSVMEQL